MAQKSERRGLAAFLNRKGAASLLVLLFLSFFLGAGLKVYTAAYGSQITVKLEGKKTQAFYIAASGLAWGRVNLEENAAWRSGTLTMTMGQAKVTVTRTGIQYQVTSLATAGRAEVKLMMRLQEEGGVWTTLYQEVQNT